MSTFLSDMEMLFTTAVRTEGISGVIINPWNRTLMLDKNLIQIVLGNQTSRLYFTLDNGGRGNFYLRRHKRRDRRWIKQHTGQKKKPETNVPELHTVEDVYEWIDKNIEYGWLGQDGKAHICEMKDFRRQYRTMSVSQTIQQKIGTCIEQVALMHELLNTIEVPNQMYCCRIYEPDDYGNLEEEEHMHCFLLYFQNGKTYHMEHPNVEQKGNL